MTELEHNQKNFVEKLSSADKTFEEIFKIDSEGLVIQGKVWSAKNFSNTTKPTKKF